MKAAVLALVLAAAHPSVASSSDNCKPVSAPAAAHYATTLIQQTHRSGVNDYEAWWAPVKKAQGMCRTSSPCVAADDVVGVVSVSRFRCRGTATFEQGPMS